MQVHRNLDALPAFSNPVVTIGSFDGVHLGHQKLLTFICQLAERCKGESILVTFDPHPRHVVGHSGTALKLLTTLDEKIKQISALGIDHLVVVPFTLAFASQSAESYLENFLFGKFQPHTVVIGYDHRYGAHRKGDIDLLRHSAEVKQIQVREIAAKDIDSIAVSSTRIRQAIASGEIESANELLGYSYMLNGKVIHGQAIGRTIGFPTANLDLQHPHKLLPADGVYAVEVRLQNEAEAIPGMLYIGRRPSLEGLRPRTIEVNILSYSGDLYDQQIRIELSKRLRGDENFESLEALKAQIERDRLATLQYFSQST